MLVSSKIGWFSPIEKFIKTDEKLILKNLIQKDSSHQQVSAWKNSIKILQQEFKKLTLINTISSDWTIVFEYELPREGGRKPDVLLISKNYVLVFEFKDQSLVKQSYIDQVSAYSQDIQIYHHLSHTMNVIPILICTKWIDNNYKKDNVHIINKNQINTFVNDLIGKDESYSNINNWINSDYLPLPSVLQAARMIFQNEKLPKIKSAESAGIKDTITKLLEITKDAKKTNSNYLVLVTGVPGSGKTLVGLQFVYTLDDPGVFLSGNGPLVEVLKHALGKGSKSFVQPVHNFLKEYGGSNITIPPENVWIYDEAQRAWDSNRVNEKRGHNNSEPDDFIKIGDRINTWSLVVGLIGEGQTIHLGEETGLELWKNAINNSPNNWKIFCPQKLENTFSGLNKQFHDELDLTKTLRSHIAEDVSLWVSELINGNISKANELSTQIIRQNFQLYITHDLDRAKLYVKERYNGQNEKRFGLIASARDKILPSYGIQNDFQSTRRLKIGPWYNDNPDSEQSCCALNSTVTEFQCQGLELDMPIVCWGDDLIWENGWQSFSKRSKAKDPHTLRLNSYRVLLTRGRDGIIIFCPKEQKLESTYQILIKSGLRILSD